MTYRGPYYNGEGYADPTAFEALRRVSRQERGVENAMRNLWRRLQKDAQHAGFEFVGRVTLRHTGTGREFR